MSFDKEWLDLREPSDTRARSPRIREFVASWLNQQPRATITDIGAGTGSTFRYLDSHLHTKVEWTFVDYNETTLRDAAYSCGATPVLQDLAQGFPSFGDLVTASAFFDLVSVEWIEKFVDALDGRALYATLTVDGVDQITPLDEDDAWVAECFRRHQTETDKGFGTAAGPDAHQLLCNSLRARGYRVDEASSPWHLRGERSLIHALLTGMAERATESDPVRAKQWLERRIGSPLTVTVGHRDLFAVPGGSRS
ncbi:MAG: class I SAM-dependent methyltransferase [Myxococcota bacterium]